MSSDTTQHSFEQAYRTGSDFWSSLPFNHQGGELIATLPKGAMILDVGSGRGRLAFKLAEEGFRVMGLEYLPELVKKNNEEVKNRKLSSSIRFVTGSVLDIPFAENSFDAVADFGLLQHLDPLDWDTYAAELHRVLKPEGYALISVLSKDTGQYLNWYPKSDENASYERDGLEYHFFDKEKIASLFSHGFELISQRLEYVPLHGHDVGFFISLLRKI